MTSADAPEVTVSDLRASYDRRVLTNVTFTVAPGSTLVIAGAPGSGKTTLVRILLGHLSPDRGEVTVDGRSVGGAGTDVHGRTGFLYSGLSSGAAGRKGFGRGRADDPDDGVAPKASVGQNVRSVAGSDADADDRVRRSLETFGLAEQEPRPAGELDAGARRRLALARVFVTDPTLVVLDDPVAGLGEADRDAVIGALQRARAGTDATIVLTCYDVTTTKAVGENMVALVNGRARMQGPVTTLMHLIESDHDYAMHFALGGKQITDSSSESLAEHHKLLGFFGYDQRVLLILITIVGVLCLLAILLFMALRVVY